MKIRDIITEVEAAQAVGQAVGRAAHGVGYAAGRAVNALPKLPADSNIKSNAKAIGRGALSGLQKWATGNSTVKDAVPSSSANTVQKIIDNDLIDKNSVNILINQLPQLKLSWRVDRNAVGQALKAAAESKPLSVVEINSLKSLLKEI
jgi:hypothetical protein